MQTHHLHTSRDINDAIRTQILAKQLDNEFSADVRVEHGIDIPCDNSNSYKIGTATGSGTGTLTRGSGAADVQVHVEKSVVVEQEQLPYDDSEQAYGMQEMGLGRHDRRHGDAQTDWRLQTQRRLYTLPEDRVRS